MQPPWHLIWSQPSNEELGDRKECILGKEYRKRCTGFSLLIQASDFIKTYLLLVNQCPAQGWEPYYKETRWIQHYWYATDQRYSNLHCAEGSRMCHTNIGHPKIMPLQYFDNFELKASGKNECEQRLCLNSPHLLEDRSSKRNSVNSLP